MTKKLIVHTDGACEPNPGYGGAAYILRNADNQQLEARGFYLGGGCTCNVAEFTAVIRAAEAAARHNADSLTIYSDSRMIVMQLEGRWRVKADHLQDCCGRALDALGKLPRWSISWIPREQNSQADTVAGNAVRFRRDVDYGERAILQPSPGQREQGQSPPRRQKFKPKRQRRGSIYSDCFRTAAAYRETIRANQLKALLFPVDTKPWVCDESPALARRGDPPTSREAARGLVESGKLNTQRQAVYDALREHDGSTHAELGAAMGIHWLVCVRRLPELERDGLVCKGEPRECRVKGSRCSTWWLVNQEELSHNG